jgi:uncharacterized protein YeeX (DUF496 family)
MTGLTIEQKTALCSAIKTTKYSKKVVILLRDLSENLYEDSSTEFINEFSTSVGDDLMTVFRDIFKNTNLSKPMDIEDKVKEVINFLKGLEEVGFTIPIHPKKEFVKRLFDWCAQNLNPEILIDFTTNRLMDSGLLMVYKGYYFEQSLENLLNDYFSQKDMSVYLAAQENTGTNLNNGELQ